MVLNFLACQGAEDAGQKSREKNKRNLAFLRVSRKDGVGPVRGGRASRGDELGKKMRLPTLLGFWLQVPL